jgi:hypothetical protein
VGGEPPRKQQQQKPTGPQAEQNKQPKRVTSRVLVPKAVRERSTGVGNAACRETWFGKLDHNDDDDWPVEGDSLQGVHADGIERTFSSGGSGRGRGARRRRSEEEEEEERRRKEEKKKGTDAPSRCRPRRQ